jgi:hypothetical protein
MRLATIHPVGKLLTLLTILCLTVVFSYGTALAAPGVAGLDSLSYVEQQGWVPLDSDVTISSDTDDFSNGYIEIALSGATAEDALRLVGGGSLSISGSAVLWNGNRIGTVHWQKNGQNGQPLRIDFEAALPNADFETGNLTGWTVDSSKNQMLGQSWAEGPNAFGFTADGTPASDEHTSGNCLATATTEAKFEGNYGLKLEVTGSVATGFGTAHCPSVLSSPFPGRAGDTISMSWNAAQTSDYYDVFGFVINSDTGVQQRLFHDVGGTTNGWRALNTTISSSVCPSGTCTNLRFKFINGTYDASGGRAVGSYLYIDGIGITISTASTNAVVESILEHVEYSNTSDLPPASRTYSVSMQQSNAVTGAASASINITDTSDTPAPLGAAPDLTTDTGSLSSDDLTNDTTPTFAGACPAGLLVRVYADGALVGSQPCSSGSYSITASELAPGAHSITARLVHATTGEESGDSPALAIMLDTTAPAAPVVSQPADNAHVLSRPVFSGTAEDGSTVTVKDGATTLCSVVVSGGSWSCQPTTDMAEQVYALAIVATDTAGNSSSPASLNITVDVTAPAEPELTSPNITQDRTPVFTGTAEAGSTVTLEVDLDGDGTPDVSYSVTADGAGNWSVDTASATPASGSFPAAGLEDGTYAASAHATDLAGNMGDGETEALVVDTGAPASPAITSPALTNSAKPVFSGTAEPGSDVTVGLDLDGDTTADVTYTVRADNQGAWSVDSAVATATSGAFPAAGLADGEYTLSAKATDAAGNTGPAATQTLTVDTLAPASTAVTSAPVTQDRTPVLSGTAEPNSAVTVQLDLDNDGVADLSYAVTADATGAWSVDTGSASPLAPGAFPAEGLEDGAYSVSAVATDDAGNAAQSQWYGLRIDTVAPAPASTSIPGSTNDTTPVFSGTAEPGSTVTVALDLDGDGTPDVIYTTIAASPSGAWSVDTDTDTPTSGVFPAEGLGEDSYDVTITVTDAALNSTSTEVSVVIDTTSPAAPVLTSSPLTNNATPVLSGTAEPGSTVIVGVDLDGDGVAELTYTTTADSSGNWSVDTGSAAPTTGAFPAEDLAEGDYTLILTSEDAAGNSTTSEALVRVDISKPEKPSMDMPQTDALVRAEPLLTGSAEPGSTVIVAVDMDGDPATTDDIVTFVTTAGANGEWSVDTATATPASGGESWGDGLAHGATPQITATSTDAAGNTSEEELRVPTVDAMAPAMPEVALPDWTLDTTPVLSGTAEPGSMVTLEIDPDNDPATDNSVVYTTWADETGAWSVDTGEAAPTSGQMPADGFSIGSMPAVHASATDSVGNTSPLFNGTLQVGLIIYAPMVGR